MGKRGSSRWRSFWEWQERKNPVIAIKHTEEKKTRKGKTE